MKAKLGQYYYAPHRRNFGVWQWTAVSETGACGTFIKDFMSKEEARGRRPSLFLWLGECLHLPKTKKDE